jgi:hypothetical protein
MARLRAVGEGLGGLLKHRCPAFAEMPAAACVPKKARARKAIINARKKFEAACGKATSSWKQLGAVVMISGGMRWRAQLSWRLPPRSRRWRWCLPELASRGALRLTLEAGWG